MNSLFLIVTAILAISSFGKYLIESFTHSHFNYFFKLKLNVAQIQSSAILEHQLLKTPN